MDQSDPKIVYLLMRYEREDKKRYRIGCLVYHKL